MARVYILKIHMVLHYISAWLAHIISQNTYLLLKKSKSRDMELIVLEILIKRHEALI